MNNILQIKQQLHQMLNTQLDEKLKAIHQDMYETSESMKNDTKSSAGDKFETGREMIQQELNNLQGQMKKLLHLQKDLSQIKLNETHQEIAFGSLIMASNGNYYMSAALGKVVMDKKDYYTLSMASPIGKALKGAKKGDVISFQGREIKILDLA